MHDVARIGLKFFFCGFVFILKCISSIKHSHQTKEYSQPNSTPRSSGQINEEACFVTRVKSRIN